MKEHGEIVTGCAVESIDRSCSRAANLYARIGAVQNRAQEPVEE